MARFSSDSRRPYSDWSNDALTSALAKGDEDAFREIYERYWHALFRTAYKKLGVREEAEELVQELFATLWAKRTTTQIGLLEHYLHRAVKYRVIDIFRAEQIQQRYLDGKKASLTDLDNSTEESVLASDLNDVLAASLQRLPATAREVFRLSRNENRSVAEIAQIMGISPKAVEYHLYKALKSLRSELKDFLAISLIILLKAWE